MQFDCARISNWRSSNTLIFYSNKSLTLACIYISLWNLTHSFDTSIFRTLFILCKILAMLYYNRASNLVLLYRTWSHILLQWIWGLDTNYWGIWYLNTAVEIRAFQAQCIRFPIPNWYWRRGRVPLGKRYGSLLYVMHTGQN